VIVADIQHTGIADLVIEFSVVGEPPMTVGLGEELHRVARREIHLHARDVVVALIVGRRDV
jgi:hypothetical protein